MRILATLKSIGYKSLKISNITFFQFEGGEENWWTTYSFGLFWENKKYIVFISKNDLC